MSRLGNRPMGRSAALLFLARCLTPSSRESPRDCAAPENPQANLATEIADGGVCWERVVEIASEYWMTLALYRELGEKGLLDLLPNDLLEYFNAILEANRARNQGILEQAGELAGLLNGIGVEPLLLKGVSHLASGLYADPAVRFMSDIDILVPEDRAPECWRLLLASGYATLAAHGGDYIPQQECPALMREGSTAEVEMHHPAEWKWGMGSSSLYVDTEAVTLGGGKARILSATSRMTFTLAHSYVQHAVEVRSQPPLRDLYDATLLMRQLDRQIAWPQVMDAFDREGQSDAFRVACMMWRRLLPPGPAIPVDRPRWAGLYWRRCMLDVRKPEWLFMRERLGVNAGLMRRMFSPTPEGKELRRTLVTPSVFLRKLRAAAQLVGGGKWR